jgi:predicted regulator of Ras-like GTPase activity (Roadblock/LC7/MglB family)
MKLQILLKALGVNSAAERKPAKTAKTVEVETENVGVAPVKESNMAVDIKGLSEIAGFIGACLVDSDTGLMMASEGGGSLDLEAAGAANTEVVKAKLAAIKMLKLNDHIDDILITLGKQYHLIRPMEKSPTIFLYVVLDRKAANLGMARVQVKSVEQTLSL